MFIGRTLLLSTFVVGGSCHGAVTFPRARQSLDAGITNKHGVQIGAGCPPRSTIPGGSKLGKPESNGQACYWFSNGCNIGCDKCDGSTPSPGHDDEATVKFLYKNMTKQQLVSKNLTGPEIIGGLWNPKPGEMVLDKHASPTPLIKSTCGKIVKPTICDSRLRTLNTQAECGSTDDINQLSPWRAPGSAPVIDSCGSAGGRLPGMGPGPALAIFTNSTKAFEGMAGSKLPPMPSQATWKAGATAQVGFTLWANHGGGYSYRLAPADGPLTEETFSRTVLDFVGNGILRWDGNISSQLEFNVTARGWETRFGTTPANSMWRKNPIPHLVSQWDEGGYAFEPVCEESEACKAVALQKGLPQKNCRCTGEPSNLEIVDQLRIPTHLKPGKYVLGWRWDCEEGGQVWNSCSDVTIIA